MTPRSEQADELQPHARRAAAERNQFQRENQPHDVFRQRRADAATVGQDQVALERPHVPGVDADARQLAEAGVHPVDREVTRRDLRDAHRPGGDGGVAGGVEPCRFAGAVHPFEHGERHAARLKNKTQISPPLPTKMRWCSGLKPSR